MSNQVEVVVRQIAATASEGVTRNHRVTMDRPEAKGGENRGPMGGELLLMSLGGCFMSNLLAAAAARETAIANARITVAAKLESAPPHFSAATMRIAADHPGKQDLEKLVVIAERGCIVANTLKKALDLRIEIA
jgi:putative redox protein